MKIGVKVLPRKEVLDTQGRTVQSSLSENGFSVSNCTIGKYIVLDVNAKNFEEAKTQVTKMAEFVLYNPLIENYEVEQL
ncbi:MAG: phosphoribosylformylglycinamidine synthase subunit PurS [Bdellovibrionota bacterium]